uniref:Uncharacterized protein n=1 Tax=Athene cunicularia TaxID=194338 RepID=A0A663MAB8_ATHCN
TTASFRLLNLECWYQTHLLKGFHQVFSVSFSSWLQTVRPVLSQADFHSHDKQEDADKDLPGLFHPEREQNIFLIVMTLQPRATECPSAQSIRRAPVKVLLQVSVKVP